MSRTEQLSHRHSQCRKTTHTNYCRIVTIDAVEQRILSGIQCSTVQYLIKQQPIVSTKAKLQQVSVKQSYKKCNYHSTTTTTRNIHCGSISPITITIKVNQLLILEQNREIVASSLSMPQNSAYVQSARTHRKSSVEAWINTWCSLS